MKRYAFPASNGALQHVELVITRTRKQMHKAIKEAEYKAPPKQAAGECWSWSRMQTACTVPSRGRRVVARIYLNQDDLRYKASEIVPHESAHAGMALARYTKANLAEMGGEEVMAYSTGWVSARISTILWGAGVVG